MITNTDERFNVNEFHRQYALKPRRKLRFFV